jgi:hypothetical protein
LVIIVRSAQELVSATLGSSIVLRPVVDAEIGGDDLRSNKDCAGRGEIETDEPSDSEGDGRQSRETKEDHRRVERRLIGSDHGDDGPEEPRHSADHPYGARRGKEGEGERAKRRGNRE